LAKNTKKFMVAVQQDGLTGPRVAVVGRHTKLSRAREKAAQAKRAGYSTRIYRISKTKAGRPTVKRVPMARRKK